MFRNYFKIAWRNMIKDRQFTFLNVFGLSAGLACTLLIWFWVHDELSVDKSFEKGDQIYQLMEYRKVSGQTAISDESSGMLGEVLATRMPEIEYAAALAPHEWFQKFTLTAGEKNIKAFGQYAGKDYFNIFSFRLLDGKKDQVLRDKNSIAISGELAEKLFGTTENLIGKPIHFQHTKDFFVSGVFEKPDSHSSQQFDFVLSFEYMKEMYPWVTSWDNTGPHNFVLMKKGTDIIAFNKRIAKVVTENSQDSTRAAFAVPFRDNYLLYTFSHGAQVGGKMTYVKLFSIIAIFILAIACINFMNLSTAKASRRLKEVGIKKVLGAGRKQLIFQFLSESIIFAAVAMVLALGIAWLLLPAFNRLTGKEIALNFNASLILTLACITLFTGLLSGSYPALYLSGFKPVSILKGKLQTSVAEMFSRKGLVVFQFTLSALLIISVLVVYRQIRFIQSADPGYNKENVLRFNSEGKVLSNEDAFVDEVKKIPGVVNACYTAHEMIGRNYGNYGLSWDGKDPNEQDYIEGFGGGYGFIETMGMQMEAGRSYSKSYGDEGSKIILNEAAVKLMRLQDPVGKTIHFDNRPVQIIGVVKNFHFESLHEPVKPCYIILDGPGNIWHKMMVKIKGGEQSSTIKAIQNLYTSYNPGFPFEYGFLDEAYQKQYLTENRVGILSRYFAGLAILISCLGLFGLATFTAQKRQKEIGIRKVVGASVNSIVFMLSKDFLRLILVSVFIAFPLAWWLMSRWLQGFAYRTNIGGEVFLITGASVVFITLLTISVQAIRAALANPVTSLRSE
jgi:putative ABC transport system permease protein